MNQDNVTTLTLVTTSQTLTIFTALMPEFSDVRNSKDPLIRDSVRTAEITATAISAVIGFGVSVAAGSSTPFLATLMVCAMLAGTYEFILSTTPPITATATEGVTK